MLLRRLIEHVRKQNWSAVGIDFVIVVVGVFIGIQVSNWNGERATDRQAARFTSNLEADLREEAWRYQYLIEYNLDVLAASEAAVDALVGTAPLSDEALLVSAYRATQYKQAAQRRATYDEVISTGTIGLIRNHTLRETAMRVYTMTTFDRPDESGWKRTMTGEGAGTPDHFHRRRSPMRTGIQAMAALLTSVVLIGAVKGLGPRTVQGECVDVFDASVCSWAVFDITGGVVEFGATVPLAAIERAPHDMEMAWPPIANATVRMPAELTAATGVDHLTMYWEPHGHPPGAYLTPHFDFHFYNISNRTREAIDCADKTKPAALPADYGMVDIEVPELGMLVGLCVPEMGMHALLASELQSEQVFDGTMVIGYYHGAPIFFEPMISRDMLLRRQPFELPMPAVSGLPAGVRYPQRFRAEYDPAADAYRFIFPGS